MARNEKKLSIEEMLENYTEYIPKGIYCYDDDGNDCPFWDLKLGEYPEQEEGYCHYLKKSDWELNETYQKSTILIHSETEPENVGKSIEELFKGSIDPVSKKIRHFPLSLLYDQCKECDINMEEE
jgi:hypothetical protein